MRRGIKMAILLSVVALTLSGCGAFFGLFVDSDVAAVSVEVDDDGTNGIENVTVTIANAGPRTTIPFGLLLSNGTSLSYASDVIIYEDEVEVRFAATETVTISRSQIDAYMSQNSETAANGTYYVGLWADPLDELGDVDKSDNQAVSQGEKAWVQ